MSENFTADELFTQSLLTLSQTQPNYPDMNILAEAIRLLRLAAEKGQMNAQSTLAHYFEKMEKDVEQAAYWYAKAAEQGHEDAAENLERLRPLVQFAERFRTAGQHLW